MINKEKCIVGIDPGLSGAIAFITDKNIFLADLPLLIVPWIKPVKKRDKKTGKIKTKYSKMVDVKKLHKLIKNCPFDIEKITIEIVHTMPKQGIASAFTFGGSFYAAYTACLWAGFDPVMVQPQAWKRKAGLIGMEKDASRILALRMYPDLKPFLKFKKNHGRSDALFIGVY